MIPAIRRAVRPAVLASLALALASAVAAAAPLPLPVERTLDNGLRVLVLSQPRLPILQIQVAIPAGSAVDPPGQEGLAALTAQMLRRGTTSRGADEFAADLSRIGGTLTIQVTQDASSVTGAFLARDAEAGIELLSNAVLDPIFPEDDLMRLRGQVYRSLLQGRTDPEGLADEQALAQALAGHRYARPTLGTTRSLNAIHRDAIRAYYRDAWRPDRAVLVFAGDITPERAFALAADWFGRWAGRAVTEPVRPVTAPVAHPRMVLYDLPGLGWSEVRMVFAVPSRREAGDALGLAVAGLTGGPGSRLSSLRGGIAGAIPRGGLSMLRQGGSVTLAVAVPVDSTVTAIRRLRAEVAAYVKTPPTEARFAALRRASAASYPMAFETLSGMLGQWQGAALDRRPADEVVGAVERMNAISAADVATAATRWLDPANAVVLVAGSADRLRGPLAKLGAFETVALEPVTPFAAVSTLDSMASATPERLARGRAVVARALAAHGGEAALRGLRESQVDGDVTLGMGGQKLEGQTTQIRREPLQMYVESRFVGMDDRQVLNGDQGWTQSSEDSAGTPVDSIGIQGLRAVFLSDPPHQLLAAADSSARVIGRDATGADAGTDDVDVVTASGERRRYHFQRSDGLLVGLDIYDGIDPQSQVLSRRAFRDFRDAGGIQWPFREERRGLGDNTMRLDVKSVRLNQGVPDVLFSRPLPRR
jgi:predicted Zn-dependent peptidase